MRPLPRLGYAVAGGTVFAGGVWLAMGLMSTDVFWGTPQLDFLLVAVAVCLGGGVAFLAAPHWRPARVAVLIGVLPVLGLLLLLPEGWWAKPLPPFRLPPPERVCRLTGAPTDGGFPTCIDFSNNGVKLDYKSVDGVVGFDVGTISNEVLTPNFGASREHFLIVEAGSALTLQRTTPPPGDAKYICVWAVDTVGYCLTGRAHPYRAP